MALSWHFQPNRAPNSFIPFTWLIHGIFMALSAKNYFEIVIIVLSCLCLSICRQRMFSSFDIIFIDAFSSWSIFWVLFLWSKYRLIRNTQTTKPNPQLIITWPNVPRENKMSFRPGIEPAQWQTDTITSQGRPLLVKVSGRLANQKATTAVDPQN